MANEHVGPVYLEPIEHVYIHRETGTKYNSVTKAIARIEPHFDAPAVAQAIFNQTDDVKNPIYVGMSVSEILDYWQMLNDEANIYGSKVHDIVERYLKANKWYFPDDPFEQKVIQGYNNLGVDEGIRMYPERIMFAEEYKIAGMSDLIIDIDSVYFDVGDWKGLPIDTPIFTNNGWKDMGTISKDDSVYDMDGEMCKILHLSDIKNKTCYKIKFDNNEEIVSDFEHRWLVSFLRDKKFKDVVMTTYEIYLYLKEFGKKSSYKLPKVKICKPLNNNKIDLPIDPYVFGVWLGDGHSADAKITNMHEDVWEEIKRRGYKIGEDVSQGGSGKATTRTIFEIRKELNKLNLLKNKHIPNIFLKSSYEQRLDLLRGFMDADGYFNKKRKRFVMSTTREWQMNAMVQIVSSLGIKTTVIPFNKKFNGKIIKVFDICFSTDNINPFLCRNKNIIYTITKNKKNFKNIISVEEINSVPTRCIEVDSKTHTFLYGYNFSITHNTNRVFNFYNPYGYECLLKPFDYLQNCQWSIYTLQLSTYALMYEMETGKKCRQIWVGYWDKTIETFQKIQIMYLKHEAKKLLEGHKRYTDYEEL